MKKKEIPGKIKTSQRSKNSLFNVISSSLNLFLSFVFAIYIKKIFLQNFSIDLQGVISLFSSIFNTLITADFGFSIMYVISLYPTLSSGEEDKTINLVSIYKKLFSVIELFIILISICLLPFINVVFNITYENTNVVIFAYLLNIITKVIDYRFKYLTGVIDACQKNYVSYFFKSFLAVLEFGLQIIAIKLFKSIYLYLLVTLLIHALFIMYKANYAIKIYPFIKCVKSSTFKMVVESGVFKKVSSYIYKVLYDLTYNSMDSIIISSVLNTTILAYVSTYTGLFDSFAYVFVVIMGSIRSTMADYLYKNKEIENKIDLFRTTGMFNAFISSVICVGVYSLVDEFIEIFYGAKYIIDRKIVVVVLLSFIIDSIFRYIENVYYIGGLVFKEKKPLILSASVNLTLSIVLVKPLGLFGVYLATFVGKIIYWAGKTFHVSKYMLNRFDINIIKRQTKTYLLILVEAELMYRLLRNLSFGTLFLSFFVKGIICIVFVAAVFMVLNCNKKEYKNILNILSTAIGARK